MKKEIRVCKRVGLTALTLTLPWLFASCATNPPVTLDTVGPKSATGHLTEGQGYLVVFSDTDPIRLGKDIPYYIHTGYLIQTPEGRRIKWVANHIGDMDQSPQLVTLPAGSYQVLARSTDYGRVRVPVVIEARQTTRVHLEGRGSWKPQPPPKPAAELVRLPDGEPIGWHELARN